MYPSVELITALATELGLPAACTPSFRDLSVNDPELADLFLHAHVRAERSDDERERESLVLTVLLAVIQRHATEARRLPPDGDRTPGVARALDLMRSCYAHRLTLADLARAAGTGRYAVIRAFQRQIGMSPYDYLTQLRVERAMALLKGGTSGAGGWIHGSESSHEEVQAVRRHHAGSVRARRADALGPSREESPCHRRR